MLALFSKKNLKKSLALIIFQYLAACSWIPAYTNTAPENPLPSSSLRTLELTASYVDAQNKPYEHKLLPQRLYVKFPLMAGSFVNLSKDLEFATVLDVEKSNSVDLGEVSAAIIPKAVPFSSQALGGFNLSVTPNDVGFFRVSSLVYSFRTGILLGDAEFGQEDFLATQQLYLVYVDRPVIIKGELSEDGILMDFDVDFNSSGFKWLMVEKVEKFTQPQLRITNFYDDSPKYLKVKILEPPKEIL